MKRFYYIIASLSFFALSACNLQENVAIKGVDLHTHEAEGDTYVDLEAIVSLGNLKLPNTTTSIQSSEHSPHLGEFTLQHLEDGTSRVFFSVNYSEALKLDSSLGKNLQNGREIPAILENEPIDFIGIPVLQNSRIYIGGSLKSDLYAGVALNIPAFDHLLTQVPVPLNLFASVTFSSEISSQGGLFSSPHMGQNGIAVFAKKSQASTVSHAKRELASEPDSSEMKKINPITQIRLSYLLHKHAIVRVK